ncbi:cuticle protein 19-like [Tigriopus californicus]|uniref:cuticle protein 19-like n=1 Tax=Tigriopus californicus TaxID=6832 RepID=UPI0027DA652B|nr:cuticle protein 19-like [Tigriopus californicus]
MCFFSLLVSSPLLPSSSLPPLSWPTTPPTGPPLQARSYKEPSYDEPAKYEYQYAVADQYAGVDFNQNEARDGYATNGEYRVVLPDGRTQIVTYTVQDAYSGYVADVKYEGEAQYPEEKPSYKPAYKPPPSTLPPLLTK